MNKNKINGIINDDIGKYLYPIINFNNYKVSDNGNVYKVLKPNRKYTYKEPESIELVEKRYDEYDNPICTLVADNGKEYTLPVAKLLMSSRIGDINLPIKFKDNNTKNVLLQNMFYDFNISDLKYTEDNKLFIKSNEFREDPLRKGYYVSNEGCVFNSMKNIFMTRSMTYATATDYYRVSTKYMRDGEMVTRPSKVHLMVYRAWIGPLGDLTVDHKNMHKYDNRVSNLEAVTHSENTRRAHDMGLNNENYTGNAAYYSEDIEKLCQMIENNTPQYIMYKYFEDHYPDMTFHKFIALVNDILRKKVYKYISSKYDI
jgi:hypothetical protein